MPWNILYTIINVYRRAVQADKQYWYCFPGSNVNDVDRMFELRAKQHEQFVETRLQKGSLMVVNTKISKNLFKLPSSTSVLKADTDQIKLNQSTLTKLDSACQNRRAVALELFKTEFNGFPECFVTARSQIS